MKTAVIILFHGSKAEGASDVVQRITSQVRQRGGYDLVEAAFLQHAKPTLLNASQRCVELQAKKIVVVPFFVQMGTHVKADIPRLVAELRHGNPEIKIVLTEPIGSHPLLVDVVLDLVGIAK